MGNAKPIVILHNLRSAHNVGATFRTADAVGVGKIYLSGYTPSPLDRFGRPQAEIAKTALGAERTVPWERAPSIGRLMKKLSRSGVCIVAVEKTRGARDYKRFRPRAKTALLFGNEVEGLSRALLNRSDEVISIPMAGKKESLNVAVAAGIVLFRLFDRQ